MARAPTDLRSLARSHTDMAVRVLVSIAKSKGAQKSARVNAATALLDRGWGKPAQPHVGDDELPIAVTIRKIISEEK